MEIVRLGLSSRLPSIKRYRCWCSCVIDCKVVVVGRAKWCRVDTRGGKRVWFATFGICRVPGVSTIHKEGVLEIIETEVKCANQLQHKKEQAAVREDGRKKASSVCTASLTQRGTASSKTRARLSRNHLTLTSISLASRPRQTLPIRPLPSPS
jgi:hypothetical protein